MFKPWDRMCRVHVHYKGSSGDRIITEDMRAAAQVATEQWNDYQTRFVPLENKFINKVNEDPALKQEKVRGQINADIAQKTAGLPTVPGVDPNRTALAGAIKQQKVGKALAAGSVQGTEGVLDQRAAGLNTVVSMGRGQAVDALQTQSALAESSAQSALSKAQSDHDSTMNLYSQAGKLGGALVGAGMASSQPQLNTRQYVEQAQMTGNWTGNPALTNMMRRQGG